MTEALNPAGEILVYKNFITKDTLLTLNQIFDMEKDKFLHIENSVHLIGFGQDNFHQSDFFNSPNKVMDKFPKYIDVITSYYKKLEETVRRDSGLDTVLSVLWFVEKVNEGFPAHNDNEPDAIYKYDRTAVLYLNDSLGGGEITFPEFGYTFSPEAGSLVSFPATYTHEVSDIVGYRRAMPSWFTQEKKYSFSNYLR